LIHKEQIIFILLLFCLTSFAQPKQKSNLEIFEQTISAEIEKYFYYPGIDRVHLFIFIVNTGSLADEKKNNESIKFLVNLLKKTSSNNNLKFSIAYDSAGVKADSGYYLFRLKPIKLETAYPGFRKNNFLGEKTLNRSITARIDVTVKDPDNNLILKGTINVDHNDEINYDNYESLESPTYDFTHGRAPHVSSIESIFFPLLLITASAFATILFFTIRTR
jgi:hypothetical protein